MQFHKVRNLHFVGIGGAGMCGMAEILHALGFRVTGCDRADSPVLAHLGSLGIPVELGHNPGHLREAEVVVHSSAVPEDHPELREARRRNLPVIKRAEMLAQMVRLGFTIAVAGTHGKTTTTSLIGHVLENLGQDPTVIVGGRVKGFPGHSRLGRGRYFVLEADEYDKSFLRLAPDVAVLTTVDTDHLDTYGDFDRICAAFLEFAGRVPFYGAILLRRDDPVQRRMIPGLNRRIVTYGFDPEAEVSARGIEAGPRGMHFQLSHGGRVWDVDLPLYGRHNVANALAALAAAVELDLPLDAAASAAASFPGVARRFDRVGEFRGAPVIDDYAHHPAEIEATLAACRLAFPDRSIVVVFQPHLYSRTRDFCAEFARVLAQTDRLVVTKIYAAREAPIPGVSGDMIAGAVRRMGHAAVSYLETFEETRAFLEASILPRDVVLTLGAGDISRFAHELIQGGPP